MLEQVRRLPRRVWDRTGGAALSAVRPGSVVMLHQHRCGSTVLGGMLKKHAKVSWCNEVVTFDMLRYERAHETTDGWTCDPRKIIKRSRRRNPRGWYGCEITTRNAAKLGMSLESTVRLLRDMGFTKFIVLERHNHLRRYLSARSTMARGRLHLNKGESAERTKVTLDPDCTGMSRDREPLLDRLRLDCGEIEQLLSLTEPLDSLHLVYEDDVLADPSVGYARICRFLRVEPAATEPGTVRTSPFPVADMLENYEQVAALLAGTEFEWMLDD